MLIVDWLVAAKVTAIVLLQILGFTFALGCGKICTDRTNGSPEYIVGSGCITAVISVVCHVTALMIAFTV